MINYGKTVIQSTQPWGLYVKARSRVLCSDGKLRSLSYLSDTPDTFFSIPAAVRIKGKNLTGYVTTEEQTWIKGEKETGFKTAFVFRQHTNHENSGLLPEWPDKITDDKEWNNLIEKAY